MGVNGLSPLIKQKFDKSSLDDPRLANKTLGVDLSIILHRAISIGEGPWLATAVPRQPVHTVEELLKSLLEQAKAKGRNITLIFVVDGKRAPPKAGEDAERAARGAAVEHELAALCASDTPTMRSV
jgi:hypothetical protein